MALTNSASVLMGKRATNLSKQQNGSVCETLQVKWQMETEPDYVVSMAAC